VEVGAEAVLDCAMARWRNGEMAGKSELGWGAEARVCAGCGWSVTSPLGGEARPERTVKRELGWGAEAG
jgi:hypothetical protein